MMLVSRKSAESVPEGNPLMVMKFWLIVSGIYIWEFLTTLDFEWSVIRRQQRYRWTIWIYSISRLSGLAVIILVLIDFYATSPINCQAWVTTGWAFSILGGYSLSTILIILRIFAIWNRNKIVMAMAGTIWVINLGFQMAGIIKIRAEWVPAEKACAITNVEICKEYSLNLLQVITDVTLLVIMLAGLLRLRQRGDSFNSISRLLWNQGVIWIAIATIAHLPLVILVFLNVTDSLSLLLLVPAMVAIIIAATRMYRSLMQNASPTDLHISEQDSLRFRKTKQFASHTTVTKDSSVVHIPSNRRLEVTVHKTFHEECPMSQTNQYGSESCPTTSGSDVQCIDKPHGLGSGYDVEGHEETK